MKLPLVSRKKYDEACTMAAAWEKEYWGLVKSNERLLLDYSALWEKPKLEVFKERLPYHKHQTCKVHVTSGEKLMGVFTLSDDLAGDLLEGKHISAEFGGYDGKNMSIGIFGHQKTVVSKKKTTRKR
jgi:hypothetical protein